MALTKKKIKYIKNSAGKKSVKDLSNELNISEIEIEKILNSLLPKDNNPALPIFTSESTNKEEFMTGHKFLMVFQAILIFMAPLISMNSRWHDFANLAQGLYIQSISGFMVLIWIIDCYFRKKFVIKKSHLYLPLGCILIWSGLSFIWSTNKSESAEIMSLWVACAVIFFVIYNMIQTPWDLASILVAITTSMGYLIIIGMIQFFNPSFDWYNQVISPAATFGNKNMFCDYLIIVLPLCFYFFMRGEDKTSLYIRIISGTLFCSGILIIIFAMTRAGMLAFPILIFLFFTFIVILKLKNRSNMEIFSKQKTYLMLAFFTIPSILLFIFMLNYNQGYYAEVLGKRIKSIFVLPDKDKEAFGREIKDAELKTVSDSTTIRLITWANTLKMIQDKPIVGVGLYNWQIHYGEYRRAYFNDPTYMPGLMLAQVHNDYLQILADLGLIGFLLFFWLIFAVFNIFKRLFFDPDVALEQKFIALSLILCVVGFGITCNFSFLIVKSVPAFLLFIYFALLGNLYYFSKIKNKANKPEYIFKYNLTKWLFLPLLIIAYKVTTIEINRGITDQLFKTAVDSFRQQKNDITIEACKEILARNPLYYRAHFVIAEAYSTINELDKAAYHIETGIKYFPNDLYGLFQAGNVYINQLKKVLEKPNPNPATIKELEDKTLYWYARAFAIREDFGKPWNNLGYLYERRSFRFNQTKQPQEAQESLKKAIECIDKAILYDNSYTEAFLNKANILQNTGHGDEAISIALHVLKSSLDKYIQKDSALQKLNKSNIQKNTGKFNDAVTAKIISSQAYLNAAPRAIQTLKIEYTKNKNDLGMLEVFEYEKIFLTQQLETQKSTFSVAEREYEIAKKNSDTIRKGLSLSQLEKYYLEQQFILKNTEAEFNKKMSRLLIESSNIKQALGKTEESISTLNQVIEMAKKSNGLEEYDSIARIQINAMYLMDNKLDLTSKISIIEENFQKATFKGNPDLTQHKIFFEQKFNEAKKTLKLK